MPNKRRHSAHDARRLRLHLRLATNSRNNFCEKATHSFPNASCSLLRREVRRIEKEVGKTETPYGPLVQCHVVPLSEGKTFNMEYINPFAIVWYLTRTFTAAEPPTSLLLTPSSLRQGRFPPQRVQ